MSTAIKKPAYNNKEILELIKKEGINRLKPLTKELHAKIKNTIIGYHLNEEETWKLVNSKYSHGEIVLGDLFSFYEIAGIMPSHMPREIQRGKVIIEVNKELSDMLLEG